MSTPTLFEVIDNAVEAALTELHTAMPGQVVSYDIAKNTCTVAPCRKKKYEDGTLVDLPQVTNVPVVFPRAGNAFLSLPIKAGDYVLLVFSERSLDQFLAKGGIQDPRDPRKFDLSDGIAIPGLYPTKSPAQAHAANLRLQNASARIDVFPTGKFRIESIGGDELLSQVSALAAQVKALADAVDSLAGSVNTGFTALVPEVSATAGAVLTTEAAAASAAGSDASSAGTEADTIKGKVEGLTGVA